MPRGIHDYEVPLIDPLELLNKLPQEHRIEEHGCTYRLCPHYPRQEACNELLREIKGIIESM